MWRASFEWGVDVTHPHPVAEQTAYLLDHVAPSHRVVVAHDDSGIVGFLASTDDSVGQLYVRVDRIGRGIGSRLLNLAKQQSSGHLWLYTFACNHRALTFYTRHGFAEVARGLEPTWQGRGASTGGDVRASPGQSPVGLVAGMSARVGGCGCPAARCPRGTLLRCRNGMLWAGCCSWSVRCCSPLREPAPATHWWWQAVWCSGWPVCCSSVMARGVPVAVSLDSQHCHARGGRGGRPVAASTPRPPVGGAREPLA